MTMTTNRIGLLISALIGAAILLSAPKAHACGGDKGGCGCHKAPVGVELPKDYPQDKPTCAGMGDGKKDGKDMKAGGCGCGMHKGGAPAQKKTEKDARAGYLL